MEKHIQAADPRIDYPSLASHIKRWGTELGFQQVAISDTRLDEHEAHLLSWLDQGRHGEMDYMQRHGTRRSRPAELVPGTLRVIVARMDYWPPEAADPDEVIADPARAYVSRSALGRDYHKVLRRRLQKLADRIGAVAGPFGYRAFCDSAPVLEKALAEKAGLGWIGKHTNLLTDTAGSWFFLGELYTNLPLPVDAPARQPLRHLPGLPAGLPDRRHRGALSAGCAPVHFLSHHRTARRHTGAPASADRQPHLRLR
jgi:epoxyqueuosine reductase